MNLFEIDRQISECVDFETGEIIDIEKLEALTMERDAKIENVALWIKNLEADAKALDEQEKAFKERKDKAKKKAESLKKYLASALDGQKLSTARCMVSFRKTSKVNVLDESVIPTEYMTEKVTREPNKTAIGAAIKAGMEIPGCELVQNINPTVR